MNLVILIGRVVADPVVSRTSGEKPMVVAKYKLAVDRKFKKDGETSADFPSCTAFGKNGEFAQKYLHKGMKIAIRGELRTGSYVNKDGNTVYTTDVIVDHHEFCEPKSANSTPASGESYDYGNYNAPPAYASGVTVPATDFAMLDDDDAQLPF